MSLPSNKPPRRAAASSRSIGAETPFYRLFDHLPEISFFAKDRHFRLMCASQRFLERFGFHEEAEIIGKDDFELFPERLAENFRRDDEEVMRHRRAEAEHRGALLQRAGRARLVHHEQAPAARWRGAVIGVMGTVHSYEGRREVLHPYLQLDRAIAYIREHFRSGVSVKELAHAIHVSPRQLHRKFMGAFGSSPQTFIMKLRIQAACEALQRKDAEIQEVARAHGFCSQSAFTQLFQKYVGLTPLKYQRRFRLETRRMRRLAEERRRIETVSVRHDANLGSRQLILPAHHAIGQRRLDLQQCSEAASVFLALRQHESQQFRAIRRFDRIVLDFPSLVEVAQQIKIVGLLFVQRMAGEQGDHLGRVLRVNLITDRTNHVPSH